MSLKDSEIKYLQLDHEVESQIISDRENHVENPFKFKDENIVRRHNLKNDMATLSRPAFMRDVEKIINLPAYNRYNGKTQVFSLLENDDITRRGLHVQLVNRVARGIGQLLGLNLDLIDAISLGHDLGHTPFGHAGERFLSECYNDHTGKYFHHNVHSVRVLDQLFPRNISLQTLDGIIKHNGEFAQKVVYRGEIDSFEELDDIVEACNNDEKVIDTLRPATLEGCVVRVSDMIAYIGKDRDDALKMSVLDSIDEFDSTVIGKTNAKIINNLTVDIVNHSYFKDSIQMSEEVYQDLKLAKKQNYERIYSKEGILEKSFSEVQSMFHELYEKNLEDLESGDETSPIFRHHIKNLVETSHYVTTEEYLKTEPNKIVCDYIASMTDNYFVNLYEHMFPKSEKHIYTRDYCEGL